MTMKRNPMTKLMTSITMTMILCLSMALPAFAQPVLGTEEKEAEVTITKALKMGEGVTTPEITFTFKFTADNVDEVPSTGTNMPSVVDKTVTYSVADAGTTVDGVKTVHKETESLFNGVTWPHAGVYTYTVKEDDKRPESLTPRESLDFSQAEYKIRVYVANGEDGLYVAAIGTEIVVADGENGVAGEKVDGTPGDPTVEGKFSNIIFTNTYMKTAGTGNPEEYALAISKTVASSSEDAFDTANRTQYFGFQVTVDKSNANSNASQTYMAYIMDANGVVADIDNNYDGTALTNETYGKYIPFTTGQAKTVSLKHGQWISFVDLEVGATYTVTELAAANFMPKCDQVIGGEAPIAHTGTLGAALSVLSTSITENEDRADFTNTYKTVTPTGLSVDNLPYIVLIGLGLGTLVGFAAAKSRKNHDENAKTA